MYTYTSEKNWRCLYDMDWRAWRAVRNMNARYVPLQVLCANEIYIAPLSVCVPCTSLYSLKVHWKNLLISLSLPLSLSLYFSLLSSIERQVDPFSIQNPARERERESAGGRWCDSSSCCCSFMMLEMKMRGKGVVWEQTINTTHTQTGTSECECVCECVCVCVCKSFFLDFFLEHQMMEDESWCRRRARTDTRCRMFFELRSCLHIMWASSRFSARNSMSGRCDSALKHCSLPTR